MERVEITLREIDGNIARIVDISDIHVGSAGFNKEAFFKTLDDIAMMDIEYLIVNGDMINGISRQDTKRFDPQSIHDDFKNIDLDDMIMAECDTFIEYMQTTVNSGIKVILVEGNHETAIEKYHGFSPYRYIGRKLDAIMIGQSGIIKVNVGSESYSIAIHHGSGGGGTLAGSAINKAEKLAKPYDVDFFTMGHVHKMAATLETTLGDNGIRRKWIIVTGCYLDSIVFGKRNYFINSMTSNSHIGYAVLEMRADKHYGNVSLRYL